MKFLFFAFIIAALLTSSCRREAGYHTLRGGIWHTLYTITYQGPVSLEDSVLTVLDAVGSSLSVFDSASVVSRVNNAAVSAEVDSAFARIYRLSRKVSALSGGAFDPTVSPLIEAWGFGKSRVPVADTTAVDSILRYVGIGKTRLEGSRLIKDDPRISFNLSGIAKGYGCDMVGEMLRRNHVDNFMIEIGGEVLTSGQSPKAMPWRIAIEAPKRIGMEQLEPFTDLLHLSGEGVASSSNDKNYHDLEGRRQGHIISPVTGRPATTDVLSATVVAPSCAEADALATACMVMSADSAAAMLRKAGRRGLLVTQDTIIKVGWKK